jgi:hypothetical protein
MAPVYYKGRIVGYAGRITSHKELMMIGRAMSYQGGVTVLHGSPPPAASPQPQTEEPPPPAKKSTRP